MPFELIITRTSIAERGIEIAPSAWSFLYWGKDKAHPITDEDFATALSAIGVNGKVNNASMWLWNKSELPWCSAELIPQSAEGGYLVLSTSYCNSYFMRVWKEGFELALAMAKAINAKVIEWSWKEEVTPQRAAWITEPEDEYYQGHLNKWRQLMGGLYANHSAPLEIPVNQQDFADEFFLFQIYPDNLMPFHQLTQELNLTVDSVLNSSGGSVIKDENDLPVSRFFVNADGSVVLSPAHGDRDFSKIAPVTVELAERIHGRLKGSLLFNGLPFDSALRSNVLEKSTGLAVEFYLGWNQILNH